MTKTSYTVGVGKAWSLTASCASGTIATGGGFAAQPDLRIEASGPADERTWRVRGNNVSLFSSRTYSAYAVCVK